MEIEDIPVQQLFDINRLKDDWEEPGFMIYFPFGVLLVIFRILLCLVIFPIMLICESMGFNNNENLRRKVFWFLLGVKIKIENEHLRKTEAQILLANHVTIQDSIAVDLVIKSIEPMSEKIPQFVKVLLGCQVVNKRPLDDRFNNDISQLVSDSSLPILIFPEETTTNGRTGMLKLAKCPVVPNVWIQPLSIKISGPLHDHVSLSTLSGSWVADLFWLLFLPWTIYQIRFLSPFQLKEEDTTNSVTQKLSETLSQDLGYPMTNHTAQKKFQLMGRRVRQSNVIDLTVSTSSGTTTAKPIASKHGSPSLALPTKPKNQMTYAERKQLMIVEARKKYLARHAQKLMSD